MKDERADAWYIGRIPIAPRSRAMIFTPTWLFSLVDPGAQGPIKVGFAAAVTALVAVIADGITAFTAWWWIAAGWLCFDTLLGILVAFRDPAKSFRAEKLMDAAIKAVLLALGAPLVRAAELAAEGIEVGFETHGAATLFFISLIMADSFVGAIQKGEKFVPKLHRFRGRYVSWEEGGEIRQRHVRGVVLEDDAEMGDD